MFWRLRTTAKEIIIDAHRRAHRLAGANGRYEMPPGYRHRSAPNFFDDSTNADEWQREVYAFAAAKAGEHGLRTVFDIGCGSGFKLLHYLGTCETVGFDLEPTLSFLRQKYPDRRWELSSFERTLPAPDLVICSDVVEHVPDPDALMRHIAGLGARHVVLSTPDRDLLYPSYSFHQIGPPRNQCHMREWNAPEFRRYAERFFDILDQRITNREQATQMVHCRARTH